MSNPYRALCAQLNLCPQNSTGEASFLHLLLTVAADGYDLNATPWTEVGPACEVLKRLSVHGRSHAFQRLEAYLNPIAEREVR